MTMIAAPAHSGPALFILVIMQFSMISSSYDVPPPPHEGELPIGILHNGDRLPLVGLGGCNGVRKEHVLSALDAGYRHVDTAQAYTWGYHEDEVGDAIQESPVDRSDMFIQSKIHPEDLGYEATKKAVAVSLDRLHVSHLDSMLLHKPRCWAGACRKEPEGTWQESWLALEELYDAGQVGAIGICDVDESLMADLLRQRTKPHIIQNWMDPFHQDKKIRQRCKEKQIQYQAYSLLGTQWLHHRGYASNPVLNDPTLQSIAKNHGVDVAQVVINWATRHGVAVLPASTNSLRQISNLNSFSFDLTDDEMRSIDALDGSAPKLRQTRVSRDPNEVSLVFENRGDASIKSYWVNESSGEEVHVGELDGNGELSMKTFHGHTFVFKDQDGSVVFSHTVAKDGGHEQRHVVMDSEEL